MKLKKVISLSIIAVLSVTSSCLSASGDLNKKPLEIGFEAGQERRDSDYYDFLDEPYSLTSGDYYMGLSMQSTWIYRGSIGDTSCNNGTTAKNIFGITVTGINSYCSWSHLYRCCSAFITKSSDGIDLRTPVIAYGPTGIFFGEDESQIGIKEYAQLHDAKITGNGTYTVGIQGYNFKNDGIKNKEDYFGNGINKLYISSNFKYDENNGVKIKNPVLKLYNSENEYNSKMPYKIIQADYWLTGTGENDTGYTEFKFVNDSIKSGEIDSTFGKIITFDKKYQSNIGSLDIFGLSGWSGNVSEDYESGYEGCQYLPEYAIELTFDVEMPQKETTTEKPKSNSIKSKQTTTKSTAPPIKTTKPVIKTKKATIQKLTPKKKALKITWKKVSEAKGYEIKLATNKNFTKNKKTIKVKKGSATSKTIKKLKSGKKYFVKIRAYKKVKIDGYTVTANGPWSKVKSKKVK